MNITELVFEANVAAKLKDPKTIKMLAIAMRHDGTLPKAAVAKLGTKPDDHHIMLLWSHLLDQSLTNTKYGNISTDGKFDEWLTRLYMNGSVDYEDVNGEGGDALGAWKALSIRQALKPEHQDLNRFKSLRQIQAIIQDREYRDILKRIQDQEVIEKHKRDKKEITVLDNDRFLAVVPLNYGSCYTFNNAHGYNASFCTGSSSGHTWFNRYADDGPIVSIFDKQNPEDVNGKWQMHAPTNQLNNGNQTVRSDKAFAELFPGLMKEIIKGLEKHAAEIKTGSEGIVRGGYDMAKAVNDIKAKFPLSVMSGEEPEKPEAEQNPNGPGRYLVTQTASGRTAHIDAQSLEDARQQLLTRHPGLNLDDFTFQRQEAQNESKRLSSLSRR
jgi:hypothetical protein